MSGSSVADSSGGPSRWHFPTWFFTRRTASVARLQDHLADPMTSENFSVSTADIVEATTTTLLLGTHRPVRRRINFGQLH